MRRGIWQIGLGAPAALESVEDWLRLRFTRPKTMCPDVAERRRGRFTQGLRDFDAWLRANG